MKTLPQFLIIFLLITNTLLADDLILFPKNKIQSEQINDALKTSEKKEIDLDQSFSSLRVSDFEFDSGIKPLEIIEIIKDASKLNSEGHWYNHFFDMKIAVPFAFTLPNIVGPFGVNFGSKPGTKIHLSLITPESKLSKKKIDDLSKVIKMKDGVLKGIDSVKIPTNSDSLFKEYKEGTELISEGKGFLTTYTGVNVGIPGASANANITAVIEGELKRKIKILENGEQKFAQLRVERSSSKGKGKTFDAGINLTLFESVIPAGNTNINFTGSLRVNIISKSFLKSQKDNVIWDFTYDLAYPKAKHALNQALKGDLISSQHLAKTRFEAMSYEGVVLNETRTDLILNTIHDSKYGFRINESSLDNSLSNVYARDKLSGFFEVSETREKQKGSSEQKLFYREESTLKEFEFKATDSTRYLFGLVKNNKNLNIKSRLMKAQVFSEGQGVGEVNLYKVTFNYENDNNTWGERDLHLFLNKASQSFGWNNSPTRNFITSVDKKKLCSKKVNIKVNTTIYQDAFEKMISYEPKEIWAYFGKFIGEDSSTKLRYEKTRNKIYSAIRKQHMRALKNHTKNTDINNFKNAWKFELFKNFKNQNFPEKLAGLKSITNPEKRIEALHNLISSFELTDDLMHFLMILGQGDNKGQDKAHGIVSKISIESPNCEFNWRLDYKPNFSPDDLFSDWD